MSIEPISIHTRQQISKLYFPKFKVGKISKKIIELLIVQNQSRKSIYEIIELDFAVKKNYIRHFLWDLKLKRLIKEYQNNFELTTIGKFIFLMCKYGINFIQLCFLLETFYFQFKMVKSGCKAGFYGIVQFMDKVEHVFTSDYVIWSVSRLSKKGLIYRHHKSAFSVVPQIYSELTRNYDIVDSFHCWFIESWRKKREIILNDPLIIQRQHDYSDLLQKMVV